MKHCFKCGGEKPIDEFYRHPKMGDGHLGKCKDCTKRDTAEREARLRSTPEGLEADRARHREKYHRLNYAERYRGRSRKYQAAYRARYPEKTRARIAVNNAVRDGRLHRPAGCSDCDTPGKLYAHHEDYAKPLDVVWLCSLCHGKRHRAAPERKSA